MKKSIFISIIIILSSGVFTTCKKDKGDPPVLPPLESIIIDFSNFTSSSKSFGNVSEIKGVNDGHWGFASGVVLIWWDIIYKTLAVPVASIKLAPDQNPVYVSEKLWQWSYNVTSSGQPYKARLTGQINATDVSWKMYITKEGAVEFVWIEGTSKLDGTGGQWIINESSQSPVAYLQVDWTRTGTTIGSVKYSIVKKSDSLTASSIEYSSLTTGALNASFKIHNVINQKTSDITIEWSTTNRNGRVKSLDYLIGTSWYCWSEQKVNITCPL